jgi:hypothetical protein
VLALEVIRKAAAEQGLSLEVAPVVSSDAVLVAQAQVSKEFRLSSPCPTILSLRRLKD